jgi:hypothetical protein
MNIVQIDRILAAYERAGLFGTIPEAKRIAVTAQALGISEELVKEALGVEA